MRTQYVGGPLDGRECNVDLGRSQEHRVPDYTRRRWLVYTFQRQPVDRGRVLRYLRPVAMRATRRTTR